MKNNAYFFQQCLYFKNIFSCNLQPPEKKSRLEEIKIEKNIEPVTTEEYDEEGKV